MRKQRPSVRASDTKSNDQRWFGPSGSTIGLLVPSFVRPFVGRTLHKFGGVLGAQVTQEEGTSNTQESSEQQDSEPVDLKPALENIEAAIRDLIAQEDKVAADAQEEREKRDLEAQEGMADWAEKMFGLQPLLLFLLHSLCMRYSKRSTIPEGPLTTLGMLRKAKETTTAAQQTITVTREIGKAQVRAYVAVEDVTISDEPDENGCFHGSVVFRNSGQSPAREIRQKLQIIFGSDVRGVKVCTKDFVKSLPKISETGGIVT